MLIRRFLREPTFVKAAVALGTAARFRVGNAITVEAHGGANRTSASVVESAPSIDLVEQVGVKTEVGHVLATWVDGKAAEGRRGSTVVSRRCCVGRPALSCGTTMLGAFVVPPRFRTSSTWGRS